jgi:hypothetical protein
LLAVLGLVLNGAIRLAKHRILFWDRSRDAGVPPPTKGDDP